MVDCSKQGFGWGLSYVSTKILLAGYSARLKAEMESRLLSRRALASPTMCRFSPALSVYETLVRSSICDTPAKYKSLAVHQTERRQIAEALDA